ncbi:MAG: ATP12 family protein [Erythrobacter sp.]
MVKRFYKEASVTAVEGGWQVMLDDRGVKTVNGAAQLVPREGLAEALAHEWAAQGEELDPKTLPMRDMADYAIDLVAADPDDLTERLTAYGDTDTLLYRADPEDALFAKQEEVWEPIVTAFEAREGVILKRISGIIHHEQDPKALETLRVRIERLNAFEMAGLEAMTMLSASLTIGLCALTPNLDAVQLWRAASLEEEWQADLWGRDEEAEERRAKREADFLRACEFTRLSRPQ